MTVTLIVLCGVVLVGAAIMYVVYKGSHELTAIQQRVMTPDPVVITARVVDVDTVVHKPLPILHEPLKLKSDKEEREYTKAMEWCSQNAVPLPSGYFRGWQERFEDTGKIFTALESLGTVRYPMVSFAHATQGSSVPYRVKQQLWSDPEFLDMVRMLFKNVEVSEITDVVGAAEECISSAYNKHVGRFILAAVHKGLVGECVTAGR